VTGCSLPLLFYVAVGSLRAAASPPAANTHDQVARSCSRNVRDLTLSKASTHARTHARTHAKHRSASTQEHSKSFGCCLVVRVRVAVQQVQGAAQFSHITNLSHTGRQKLHQPKNPKTSQGVGTHQLTYALPIKCCSTVQPTHDRCSRLQEGSAAVRVCVPLCASLHSNEEERLGGEER